MNNIVVDGISKNGLLHLKGRTIIGMHLSPTELSLGFISCWFHILQTSKHDKGHAVPKIVSGISPTPKLNCD